jgi:hypothetical protein
MVLTPNEPKKTIKENVNHIQLKEAHVSLF